MSPISRSGACLRWALLVAVLLVSFVALAAPADASPASADGVTYVVKSGDTLAKIAGRYGVSVKTLMNVNGLASSELIRVGQRLVIPGSSGESSGAAVASSGSKYTVKVGDTLDKIARAYGVSAASIIKANGLRNADLLNIGQKLVIPGSSGASAAPAPKPKPVVADGNSSVKTYAVKPGDSLAKIAEMFGTTPAAIAEANRLASENMINAGIVLLIPGSGGIKLQSYSGQASKFVASISQQRCWLYQGDTVIAKWPCSSGRRGSATRPGTYKVQSKMVKAYGSTWNIWMPYWLGIYWAGPTENGIHGLPWSAKSYTQLWTGYVGTKITYGCIMLDNPNAKMLFDMAYIGMPVIIQP